jgi:hypothetical protein
MKISKIEFDRFWEAVLGSDWYVDEGPCPEDGDEPTDLYAIDEVVLGWQGPGDPEPTQYIKAKDLEDGARSTLSMEVIYLRWIKAQKTRTLVVTFDVPKDALEELTAKILALGGKIIKSERRSKS